MDQSKRKFKIRSSLKLQIFAVLFVSIFGLSTLFALFFFSHERDNLIQSAIDHNLAGIRQSSVALDDHMAQLDSLAQTIGNSQLVNQVMQADPDTMTPLEYMKEIDHLRDILDIYTANDPHIQITLFDADRIAPTVSSAAIRQDYDFTQDPIYAALQTSGSTMLILHDNPQNYLYNNSDSQVITFAYQLGSRYTGNVIGYLLMDIQTDSVAGLLSSGANADWTGIILSARSEPIVRRGNPLDASVMEAATQKDFSKSPYSVIDGNYIVFSTQSEFTGWTVLSIVDYRSIRHETSVLRTFIPVLLVVMLALAVGISFFLSRYFSKPIITLSNSMQEVSQGDLEALAPIHRSDELGQLAQHFNAMITQVRELIHKNKQEAMLKQKAQVQELQNRVNPHFIYNTLELIAGMSTNSNAGNIRQICNHLSAMMRYNLRPENLVCLRDELSQVEDYLIIMQQRMGNQFSYEIVVKDPQVLDRKFCKMALQPLVENSIKHGFSGFKGNGMICITVGLEQDCLYCLIQDNGCGITPERLEQLNTAIKNTVASPETLLSTSPHGVLNVYTRLRMLFGQRLEFRLASRQGAGTSITILLEDGRDD